MPLAPESWIDWWYSRKSPFYKSFSYSFQNPLWNKPIPQGYTLCPFWWRSVLLCPLMCIFWIWPIAYVIKPILGLLHLDKVDKFLYDHNPMINTARYEEGIGIGMTVAIMFVVSVVSVVGYLLVLAYIKLHAYLHGAGVATLPVHFAIWDILFLVAILIGIAIYNNDRYGSDKCKVETWVHAWAAATFVLACCVDIHGVGSWFGAIGNFFAFLWHSICKGSVIIAGWIKYVALLDFMGHNLWLIVLTFGVGITGVALLVNWIDEKFKILPDMSVEARKEREYKKDWTSFWKQTVCKWYIKRENDQLLHAIAERVGYEIVPPAYLFYSAVYEALETVHAKWFEDLKHHVPGEGNAMNHVPDDFTRDLMFYKMNFEIRRFVAERVATDPNVAKWISSMERKKAREKWLDENCHTVTGAIHKYLTKPVSSTSVYCWKTIKSFFCGTWALAKAMKQKHCPYRQFHD